MPSQSARLMHLHPQKKSALFACEKLRLLFVKGSGVERARLHGELLGNELSLEIMHYFAGKAREPLAALPGSFARLPEKLFLSWIKSLYMKVPVPLREEIRALAHAAGVTEEDLLLAISAPDLGTMSNAWLLNPAVSWAKMRFGCTSVAVQNSNGDFALARNLDFAGVGRFDEHPLVIVHQPDDPAELKRISIAADGIHFASVSAINSAGIGLVVHQNFTREADARSMPLLLVGDWILRQARTLETAMELLRAYRPGPMWTFLFFDVQNSRAVSVEASRGRFGVRTMQDGLLLQTNHCLSEDGKKAQFSPFGTYVNSCTRFHLAQTLAQSLDKNQSGEKLAHSLGSILGSGPHTKSGDLSIHDSIQKPITIQSMVFERSRGARLGQLWVTCDSAPAPSGRFIGLDLDALFAAETGDLPSYQVREFLKPPQSLRERQLRLSAATRLSFDERDDHGALELIKNERAPGLLLLKAVLNCRLGRYSEALECAALATSSTTDEHIQQSLLWVRALSLYQLGKKPEAQSTALTLLRQSPRDQRWRNMAKRLAYGQTLRQHELNLIFDFSSGDLASIPQPPH